MNKKTKNYSLKKSQGIWGWIFVSPYVISLLVLFLIPLIFAIYISFTKYDLFNPPAFIGVKNYIKLLKSPEVWQAFRNTVMLVVMYLPLSLFIACIIAVLLNRKSRLSGFFKVVYYTPVVVPAVAVTVIWSIIFNPENGILNYLLSFLGIGPFDYIYSTNWFQFLSSVAVMDVWKIVGSHTLYLLAGLQAINTDVLEAADVDGAGPVQKFFKITLPLLSPTLYFLLMVGLINGFQAFDNIYMMQKQSGVAIEVFGTLIYKNAFSSANMGYASAIGWFVFVIVGILTYLQNVMEKRWVNYD